MKTALFVTLALCVSCGEAQLDVTQARDLTSCARVQWAVPCEISVACGRPIEDCLADGCRINGTGATFFPDGSWTGPGSWSLDRNGARPVLHYADVAAVVQDDGLPIACP